MPKTTLENPFKPKKPLKDDDIELVRGVLGNKDANEMARLTRDENPKTVESRQKPLGDLEKTKEEQEELEKDKPWTRDQVVEWAESFGENKDWVDEHFLFKNDGSIETTHELNIFQKGISEFPSGVTKARGSLILVLNQLTTVEGLPKKIEGSLALANNQIPSLDGLSKTEIDGNLALLYIPAVTIPEDVIIKGDVYINAENDALIKDAKSKGYKVRIG